MSALCWYSDDGNRRYKWATAAIYRRADAHYEKRARHARHCPPKLPTWVSR